MDSSHAFDFPLGDLPPTQQNALDVALTRESIDHAWHGTTLSVDVAYEARVTTLIDQARSQVLPYSPPVDPTTPAAAPTTPAPPAYPAAAPGYGYGTNYPPSYGYGYVQSVPNNGLAVASMVLGIVALVFCGLVTGIPAVICGIISRRQIRASGGTQQGDGMALAGIITGGISVALWLVVIAFYVVIFVILAAGTATTR